MKLGIISSEDLQIIFWQAFDLIINYEQHWRHKEGKSKNWGWNSQEDEFRWKHKFGRFLFLYSFRPDFSFHPQFHKTRAYYPQSWSTLWITLLSPDFLPGFLPGYVDTIVFHQSFSEFSLQGGLESILLNVQSLKDPVYVACGWMVSVSLWNLFDMEGGEEWRGSSDPYVWLSGTILGKTGT
jgi:hypothetical protein